MVFARYSGFEDVKEHNIQTELNTFIQIQYTGT